MSLPFAMVRHGRDDVPVLLGTDGRGELAGLDLVDGRFLALDPGDVGAIFDTDPAAVYFGVQLAWARAADVPMAAEDRDADLSDLCDDARVWYHGSPLRFEHFHARTGSPFGGPSMVVPIFLTCELATARAHAGPAGWVYTVQPAVRQVFRGQDLFLAEKPKWWPPEPEVPRWAPVCQEAIRKGMRDRELREHLFLHTDLPAGISLAKLSFVLALLGQNLVCLDVRLLDRMFGAGMASRYSGTWDTPTQLSLTRYEHVEDAFLRDNPLYRAIDPLGRARAQWASWESVGGRVEAHHVWLNAIR